VAAHLATPPAQITDVAGSAYFALMPFGAQLPGDFQSVSNLACTIPGSLCG